MADQNLLDAINVGEKNLLDTIDIDKPLDINLCVNKTRLWGLHMNRLSKQKK